MRHRKRLKLKKGYDNSRRILKSMNASLILHEKLSTTPKKARLVKAQVEKLVTVGKNNNLHSKRILFSRLPKNAAKKVFEVLGPKYKGRSGGYLRQSKIGMDKNGIAITFIEFV